jgi:hypothetical protein
VAHILKVWFLLSTKIPISSRSVENSSVMSHFPAAPLVLTNSAQFFFQSCSSLVILCLFDQGRRENGRAPVKIVRFLYTLSLPGPIVYLFWAPLQSWAPVKITGSPPLSTALLIRNFTRLFLALHGHELVCDKRLQKTTIFIQWFCWFFLKSVSFWGSLRPRVGYRCSIMILIWITIKEASGRNFHHFLSNSLPNFFFEHSVKMTKCAFKWWSTPRNETTFWCDADDDLRKFQENWWMAKGLVNYTKLFNLRATFRIFIDSFSSR